MAGSTNVGSIHYELGLDTSKFDAASRNIQGKLSNMGNAFGGIADAMGNFAFKAAILGTTSSVGVATFVKSAADLQQTSKSFEVLTGNVDTANKLFAQLAKYANSTPFEFPQIAKAGQILLGFGIKSEEVFSRVQMLGDIAAATGADFESLALVFGQVNATGRLMGQDALQLINNKIPITSILAKKLGISVQEVKARMEDGKISVEDFNSALEGTTKQGGFAFKGTEVLATSLNGRLSTLKDTLLEFGRNLIGVKVDPELGLVVQPGGIFDRISQMIPKITQSLSEMTPKIAGFVNFLLDHGEDIKGVIIGFGVAFAAAKVAAIGFSIAANANPVGLIAGAIVGLIGLLTYLQVKFDWIGKTLQFLKPVIDLVTGAFKWLWGQLVQALQPAIQFISQHMEGFKQILLALVVVGFAPLAIAIGIAIGAIMAIIFVVTQVINFFNWLINTVVSVGTAIYNTLAPPIMFIANAIRTFYQVWFTIWSAIFQVTYTIVSTIVQIALVPLRALFGWIYSTVLQPMLAAFSWAFNGIANAVRGPINSMVSFVSGMMNAARNNIINPIRDAFNWVAGIAGSFIRAGGDIVGGLVRGISNGAGAVVGKIQEICRGALDSVKRFFGIKSPSKVMATQGNFIMQGLGVGLQQGTKNAISAAQQSMQRVSDQMQGSASLDTILSGARRPSSAALASQTLGGGGATVNTYIYGDTHINGETDQQAFFDRLASNYETVSRGAAT